MKFSTPDNDQDDDSWRNCAEKYQGAWWYKSCHKSHLNAFQYADVSGGKAIHWWHWKKNYLPLKSTVMKMKLRE